MLARVCASLDSSCGAVFRAFPGRFPGFSLSCLFTSDVPQMNMENDNNVGNDKHDCKRGGSEASSGAAF
jgi:hypothetical protein